MSKPAFPLKEAGVNEDLTGIVDNEGMSLLEYYAGQISPIIFRRLAEANELKDVKDKFSSERVNLGVSQYAFDFAEAMIKEAEKNISLSKFKLCIT